MKGVFHMSSAKNHMCRSHRSEPAHRFCVQQMQKFSPKKGQALLSPLFAKIGKHRMGRSRAPKKITAEQ